MISYNSEMLNKYLENDWIFRLINKNTNECENDIRTNKWLIEMENKRMIYSDVYGDILKDDIRDTPKRILDIGGGVTALTKILAKNSDYTLCDFLAHGGSDYIKKNLEMYHINWINMDWYDEDFETYDIVIANDIFPDVDQRLEIFIDKMIPRCKELRLVLTYYNSPRFYQMRRSDDSEVLTFLSWDGEILGTKLRKYLPRMNVNDNDIEFMKNNKESIYWNGRQVCYVILNGDLSD